MLPENELEGDSHEAQTSVDHMQATASLLICLATIGLSFTGVVLGVKNLLEADSLKHLLATRPWGVLPIPLGMYVALPATQTLVATWAPSKRLRNVMCSGAAELLVVAVSTFSVLCVPAVMFSVGVNG
jgi:hypothetical protein